MSTWTPITYNELKALVAKELRTCSAEQKEYFVQIATDIRAVPIVRGGVNESVFVVAQDRGIVVYYEDVEEGFNLSPLAADGSIASPGYEQWKLRHALLQLAA